MQRVIVINKPVGCTPFESIQQLKERHPEYKDIKLGYAGRLDPMADGVLVVLVGEENKKRKEYEQLPKQYTFEILFGISTDTYDIMGLPKATVNNFSHINIATLSQELRNYIGSWKQPYPPYSSPRIQGKPLFYWARHNALGQIQIPSKKVTVQDIRIIDFCQIKTADILSYITNRIARVSGDFRQQKILTTWEQLVSTLPDHLPKARIEITCSSGLYVRSLAHEIGQTFDTSALAFSITRTSVGEFVLKDAHELMDTSAQKG